MFNHYATRYLRFLIPYLRNSRQQIYSFGSKDNPVSRTKALMESVNQFVQTASTSSISASDSSPISPPDSSSTSSSDSEPEEKPNPEKIGLSFSACGFLGSYHFGVMLSFQKNGKKLLSRVTCCGGASAGSLVAALCVLAPDKLKDGLDLLYKLANELHSMSGGAMAPGFYLAERLTQVVEPFIPEDISPAQNRLFISLTQQQEYYQIIQSRLASTFGYNQRGLLESNRVVSTFPSREYLIKCLMASCYIPIYSGGFDEAHPPPEIDGVRYIDGGFTNNLPSFEGLKMVTVSPFSGSADISPQDYSLHKILEWRITVGNQAMRVNMQNIIRGAQSLFPPSIERLQRYCEMGYRDGMSFLLRNGYLEREPGTEVGRSRDRVGELPLYHKTNEASQSYNTNASSFNNSEVAAAGSWNSWDDRSFGIESKIEEYRTKRLTSNSDHETKEEVEQDYFQEMQPKIKAPSKVELLNAFKQSNNVAASQKNLFEFKEDFVDIRNTGNTLGDLELDDYSSTPNDAAWDVDVDLETVDHALREASKRERDQIRSKRQQEHEKRRVQQKQKSHNSTSISIS